MPKLTKRIADAAEPGAKPYSIYCAELKGFGIRVMPSGVKTWILDYRPHPGGRGAPKRRFTLGRTNVLAAEQAREMARANLELVRQGRDPAREQTAARAIPSFKEFAETYLEKHAKAKLKASTQVAYASIVRAHLIPKFGSEQLNTITRANVIDMHSAISKKHPITANRAVEVLNAIYRYAQDREIVAVSFNPAAKIKANKENPRKRYLTPEELQRLSRTLIEAASFGIPWIADTEGPKSKHLPKDVSTMKVVYDPFTIGAFLLLLLTGCRLREILGLQWTDYDPRRKTLFIRDAKTGDRTVYLNGPAFKVLQGLAELYYLPEQGLYVVPGRDIGKATEKPRADLNRAWRHIRAHAELANFHIHDLRHSLASFALTADGNDLTKVGKLLGHSSLQSTHRYAHLLENEHRKASNATGSAILNLLGDYLTKPIDDAFKKAAPSSAKGRA